MIIKIIFFVFLITAGAAYGQSEETPDSLYMVTYTTGKAWDHTKSSGEQLFFKSHSGHLSALRKSGVITAGARYSDKGMIIIRSQSLPDAKNIIESDSAVSHHLFNVSVDKLSVFYPGCLER